MDRVEKSVIDYLITCDVLAAYLDEMIIDEERIHVLTKFASSKGFRKKVQSDHNVLFGKFSLKYTTKKNTVRREIFNFKDKDAQKYFYQTTNISTKFRSCFVPGKSFEESVNKYYKTLDDSFHQCFKKIRIRSKNSEAKNDKKTEIQKKLKSKKDLQLAMNMSTCKLAKTILSQKIEDIENDISQEMSDVNAAKVKEHISELNVNGNFSQSGFWKLKNKLCPKSSDPPMAKRDSDGNLVTAPSQLKQLYVKEYKHRLRHRKMEGNYEDILILKNQLWSLRLHNLKGKVTNSRTIILIRR